MIRTFWVKRVLMIRMHAGEEEKETRGRGGGGIVSFKWAKLPVFLGGAVCER